ncbi:MAG: WD40 repeat domain-containing serine/threonine-protein kinase [Cyanobacteria bacterium J06638_20]
MPYCFNPACPKPTNPDGNNFCQSCGARLRLGDRYIAYQPLGQGQSSRTFVGIDTQQVLDPRCIIKQFPMGKDADAFRQETSRLAELSAHPQLPAILAYFERDQRQFLVQDFVEGRNLQQQLQERGTFDEAQIRAVLRTILPVLQYLHEHSVLHRDVKPSNLIPQGDRLMLVDIGAAKFVTESRLGKTGTLMGSAEYAAPEQLMGKAIYASDLYSLGVSCLELITGLSPFDLFDTAVGQWFWRSVSVEISADLGRILDRLVAQRVSDRYGDAASVLQDLGASPTQIQMAASWKQPVWSAIWQDKGTTAWDCVQEMTVGQAVNAIALHPSQPVLVTAHNDGQLRQWDTDTGELQRSFDTDDPITTCVALDADGQTLISGGQDGALRLWDWETGRERLVLRGHGGKVTAIALHADSRCLISASHDKTLRLWHLDTGQALGILRSHTHPIDALACTDGMLISGDAGGFVKLWLLKTRELLRTLSGHTARVSAVALLKEPSLALSSGWDMRLQLRHPDTGGLQHNLTGHLLPISALAIAPTVPLLATGSHDTLVKLWHPQDGKLISILTGHSGAISALAFTPGGTALWSGSQDGTVRRWEAAPQAT